MIDCTNIYEDLKIMIIDGEYIDDNFKNEKYMFAVRKEWMYELYKSICDHETSMESMEEWLKNEYNDEDAYLFYKKALDQLEIVFSGLVEK